MKILRFNESKYDFTTDMNHIMSEFTDEERCKVEVNKIYSLPGLYVTTYVLPAFAEVYECKYHVNVKFEDLNPDDISNISIAVKRLQQDYDDFNFDLKYGGFYFSVGEVINQGKPKSPIIDEFKRIMDSDSRNQIEYPAAKSRSGKRNIINILTINGEKVYETLTGKKLDSVTLDHLNIGNAIASRIYLKNETTGLSEQFGIRMMKRIATGKSYSVYDMIIHEVEHEDDEDGTDQPVGIMCLTKMLTPDEENYWWKK